jgi:hypothetical protein
MRFYSMQMSYRGARFASHAPVEDPMHQSSVDRVTREDLEGNVARPRLPADLAPLEEPSISETNADGTLDSYQHASLRARDAFTAAEKAAEAGREEDALQDYLRCAAAAESAHEWYLAAVSCERVAEFLVHPQPPCDVERALRMYRRAAAAYEQSGLFAESREISYRVNSMRLWHTREVSMPFMQRAELFSYWVTAGFGLRPLRVIATSLTIILLYGITYWVNSGAVDLQSGQAVNLLDSIYFSGITFVTVGYGDLIPAPHARLLALTEGFLGAFLMGFFVVVLYGLFRCRLVWAFSLSSWPSVSRDLELVDTSVV